MGMRNGVLLVALVTVLALLTDVGEGRRRRRTDDDAEDFEFADEAQAELQYQRKQVFWDRDEDNSGETTEASTTPSPPPTSPSTTTTTSSTTTTPTLPPIPIASYDHYSSFCSMVRCPMGTTCQIRHGAAFCTGETRKQETVVPRSHHLVGGTEVGGSDGFASDAEMAVEEELRGGESCARCPVTKPTYVCGSDNRTYASLCRLRYRNCIQGTDVRPNCMGPCPCKNTRHTYKEQAKNHSENLYSYEKVKKHESQTPWKQAQKHHRWNKFVHKLKQTVTKPTDPLRYDSESSRNIVPNKEDGFRKPSPKSSVKTSNVPSPPPMAEDKHRQQGHNSVLVEKLPGEEQGKKDCSPKDMDIMGNRLLDWFSVIMADAKRNKSRRRSHGYQIGMFPSHCKPEVQWIFGHIDEDDDSRLSTRELYDLEHESRENCVKPYLEKCDMNKDRILTPFEWCHCFDHAERPCAAARSRARPNLVGGYYPDCDETGYYRRTQCHSGTGLCWCVDKHGVEFANTRMRGRPTCESLPDAVSVSSTDKLRLQQIPADDVDLEAGDDDEDGDYSEQEGSADRPLDI